MNVRGLSKGTWIALSWGFSNFNEYKLCWETRNKIIQSLSESARYSHYIARVLCQVLTNTLTNQTNNKTTVNPKLKSCSKKRTAWRSILSLTDK